MEVRDVPELEPVSDDESALVGMLFDRITELYPDWPMGDRTDLAMGMLAVVKKWAHNLELTSKSTRTVMTSEVVDENVNGHTTGQLFEE
jgi:hypothetical protein